MFKFLTRLALRNREEPIDNALPWKKIPDQAIRDALASLEDIHETDADKIIMMGKKEGPLTASGLIRHIRGRTEAGLIHVQGEILFETLLRQMQTSKVRLASESDRESNT